MSGSGYHNIRFFTLSRISRSMNCLNIGFRTACSNITTNIRVTKQLAQHGNNLLLKVIGTREQASIAHVCLYELFMGLYRNMMGVSAHRVEHLVIRDISYMVRIQTVQDILLTFTFFSHMRHSKEHLKFKTFAFNSSVLLQLLVLHALFFLPDALSYVLSLHSHRILLICL